MIDIFCEIGEGRSECGRQAHVRMPSGLRAEPLEQHRRRANPVKADWIWFTPTKTVGQTK